ncbi:YigZ family protein [Pseudoxanthomonas sp. UTMC 1351]|uniref:YigZ family protein n=1 Tax=Pseudoxanthomonas sp. UTMC 1351 TaxID=2695853 RepID=UPI0034CE12F0
MSDTLIVSTSRVLEVKHSRFIVHAAPVTAPEAALAFLSQVADQAATHNCWAYRIGGEYRSSDDGEPAGTAGRPILAAIEGQGYDQVVVVVTRWFGGIKLGAGGLVRAYGGAAAECLRLAERRPLIAMRELEIACLFEDLGHVHDALGLHHAEKLGESFGESGAQLRLQMPETCVDALKSHLRDATRNRVRFIDAPEAAPKE